MQSLGKRPAKKLIDCSTKNARNFRDITVEERTEASYRTSYWALSIRKIFK